MNEAEQPIRSLSKTNYYFLAFENFLLEYYLLILENLRMFSYIWAWRQQICTKKQTFIAKDIAYLDTFLKLETIWAWRLKSKKASE